MDGVVTVDYEIGAVECGWLLGEKEGAAERECDIYYATGAGSGGAWNASPGLAETAALLPLVSFDAKGAVPDHIEELVTAIRPAPGFAALGPGRAVTAEETLYRFAAERVRAAETGFLVHRPGAASATSRFSPFSSGLLGHAGEGGTVTLFRTRHALDVNGGDGVRAFRGVVILAKEMCDSDERFYATVGALSAWLIRHVTRDSLHPRDAWVFSAVCMYAALWLEDEGESAGGGKTESVGRKYARLCAWREEILRSREEGGEGALRALGCPYDDLSYEQYRWRRGSAARARDAFEWSGAFAARAGWVLHTLQELSFPVRDFLARLFSTCATSEADRDATPRKRARRAETACALTGLGVLTAMKAGVDSSDVRHAELDARFVQYWIRSDPAPLPEFTGRVEYHPRQYRVNVDLQQRTETENAMLFRGIMEVSVFEVNGTWVHEKYTENRSHSWSILQRTLVKKGKGGRRTRSEEVRANRWRSVGYTYNGSDLDSVIALVTDKRARKFWRTPETVHLTALDARETWLKRYGDLDVPFEYWMEVLDRSLGSVQAHTNLVSQMEALSKAAVHAARACCMHTVSYLAGVICDREERPLVLRSRALYALLQTAQAISLSVHHETNPRAARGSREKQPAGSPIRSNSKPFCERMVRLLIAAYKHCFVYYPPTDPRAAAKEQSVQYMLLRAIAALHGYVSCTETWDRPEDAESAESHRTMSLYAIEQRLLSISPLQTPVLARSLGEPRAPEREADVCDDSYGEAEDLLTDDVEVFITERMEEEEERAGRGVSGRDSCEGERLRERAFHLLFLSDVRAHNPALPMVNTASMARLRSGLREVLDLGLGLRESKAAQEATELALRVAFRVGLRVSYAFYASLQGPWGACADVRAQAYECMMLEAPRDTLRLVLREGDGNALLQRRVISTVATCKASVSRIKRVLEIKRELAMFEADIRECMLTQQPCIVQNALMLLYTKIHM